MDPPSRIPRIRRCSYCSKSGHNSRTCPTRRSGGNGGVKLFGVMLSDGPIIKKSASEGNLSARYHSSSSLAASPNASSLLSSSSVAASPKPTSLFSSSSVAAASPKPSSLFSSSSVAASPNPSSLFSSSSSVAASPNPDSLPDPVHGPEGHVSDHQVHASSSANSRPERRKVVQWSMKEHRLFLIGLEKLGKGDWRGISRDYVVTRTPSQVASHAQKHFIRQHNVARRHRTSTTPFHMGSDQPPVLEDRVPLPSSTNLKAQPSLNLCLNSKFEPMEAASRQETLKETGEAAAAMESGGSRLPPAVPSFCPAPYPLRSPAAATYRQVYGADKSLHPFLPIPIMQEEPVNVGRN